LSISIFVFSLLLKATTTLLGVPDFVWTYFSGGLVMLLGLTLLFPDTWSNLSYKLGLSRWSDNNLEKTNEIKSGFAQEIFTGFALGPVFTSCSPTYLYILAVILPANLAWGILNLIVYILGLASVLFLVSILGQKLTKRMNWAANPNGLFKQIIGGLFILVGLAIIFGWIKDLEVWSIELLGDTIIKFENEILRNLN
jgi:cytochrome c-type biogenesis protein